MQSRLAQYERIGTLREEQLPPPVGRSARARVADDVSRWLDWTEQNRTIWLATIAHGEDIADPDVRRVVAGPRAPRRRAGRGSPRRHRRTTRPGCATHSRAGPALNRAATRRWLQGEATREQTHELIASTLEHVLRTFGAPSAPTRRTAAA